MKVAIYTTPTCSFCLAAKKYFREKGISFDEINVAVDREGLRELREKSGQIGVPVIQIGENIIIGFNREKIENALAAGCESNNPEKMQENK